MPKYLNIPGVEYALGGKTRGLPVSQDYFDRLMPVVQGLGEGYGIRVTSGGQARKGSGGARTGSTRHDIDHTGHSNTSDFVLTRNGQDIVPGADKEIYSKLFEGAAQAGFTGMGHYPWGVHVGGGSPAFWGPDTRSASADPAFRAAAMRGYGGQPAPTAAAAPSAVQTAFAPHRTVQNGPVSAIRAAFGPGRNTQQQPPQVAIDDTLKPDMPVSGPAAMPAAGEQHMQPRTVSTTLPATPEQIARRRAFAEAMREKSSSGTVIRHPMQGLNQMAQAAVSGLAMRGAERQERERQGALSEALGGLDPSQPVSQAQIAQIMAVSPELGMQLYGAAARQQAAERDRIAKTELAANTPKLTEVYDEAGRPQKAHVYPDGRIVPLGGSKTDTLSEEAEAQKARIAGAGATNMTITNAGNAAPIPDYPKLDKGFMYLRGPDGQVQLNEDGLPTVAPIPGGPADIEAEKIEEAEASKKVLADRSGNVVVQDIDRALDMINDEGGVLPETGLAGGLASALPGTDAYNVGQLIATVKANTGFDKLQAMRDASPTGGALGQVSEHENILLQAAMGNLDQSQDKQQLIDNMNRVRNIYLDIIHGPGNGPERRALSFEDPKVEWDAKQKAMEKKVVGELGQVRQMEAEEQERAIEQPAPQQKYPRPDHFEYNDEIWNLLSIEEQQLWLN